MSTEPTSRQPWAIVVATAGEEGPPDATASWEFAAPAHLQYMGSPPNLPASPLQRALHRAAAIAPRRRIVAVVPAEHRRRWQGPLWFLPRANAIVQPQSFGSAFGVLAALLKILDRDPAAAVVLLPSTHRVRDEDVLARWIRRAEALAMLRPQHLFVLGIEREAAVAARSYVVAGRDDSRGGFEIVELFDAPPSMVPMQNPLERRVLWNSGIVAGAGTAFLELFRRRAPDLISHLTAVAHGATRGHESPVDVARFRASSSGLEFARHVLSGQESRLRVLAVPQCGWSDLAGNDAGNERLGHAQPPRLADRGHIRTALDKLLAHDRVVDR
jgi:mannose-1-phosphate guanylyltransferase